MFLEHKAREEQSKKHFPQVLNGKLFSYHPKEKEHFSYILPLTWSLSSGVASMFLVASEIPFDSYLDFHPLALSQSRGFII